MRPESLFEMKLYFYCNLADDGRALGPLRAGVEHHRVSAGGALAAACSC